MARDWNLYFADPAFVSEPPDPLLVAVAENLRPGRALDLACGAGRHSIYLAGLGWNVTAVDASDPAILRVRQSAPEVHAVMADLERGEYVIEPDSFDLICDFYYLQRDLFPPIRAGLRTGGAFVGAIHLPQAGRNSVFSVKQGELRRLFEDWKISYYSEGPEAGRERHSARIVARKA